MIALPTLQDTGWHSATLRSLVPEGGSGMEENRPGCPSLPLRGCPLLSGLKGRGTQPCLLPLSSQERRRTGDRHSYPSLYHQLDLVKVSALVVGCDRMWHWTPRSWAFPGKLWMSRKVGGGRRQGSGQRHLAVQALAEHTHPGNLPSVAVSAL